MVSSLRYRIVDVFTERPLEGNPRCVVLDSCPPELMPRIAREANLSETTFPVKTGENASSGPSIRTIPDIGGWTTSNCWPDILVPFTSRRRVDPSRRGAVTS